MDSNTVMIFIALCAIAGGLMSIANAIWRVAKALEEKKEKAESR